MSIFLEHHDLLNETPHFVNVALVALLQWSLDISDVCYLDWR